MWSWIQQIDMVKSFRRFPVPVALSFIATICAIRFIANDGDSGIEMSPTISLLIVSYFLFLGGIIARILYESQKKEVLEYIAWGVFVVVGVIIYQWLPNDYELYNTQLFRLPFYLFGVAAILHLIIAYLPFLGRGSDGDFWEYNRKLFIRFVESGFFSTVLFLAFLLAMLALDKLFGVDFPDRTVGYIAVSMFGIFHSWYFLSKFPDLEYDDIVERPLSAFLVFTQFILIPVTMIYMVILYAYGIKIIIDGELPKGWIGNLSLWFSVIGVFTYLLNYLNPRFSKHRFVILFKRRFFLILMVPAFLMMISLYRRIGDYGVTEERYVLAMIASWIISMILIYGLLRWQSLKWLPISLSLVIVIGLFAGPMSIFSCTLRSQEKRLYNMMQESGLLEATGEKKVGPNPTIYNQFIFLDKRSNMQFMNDWVSEPVALLDESQKEDRTNLDILIEHFGINYEMNISDGYSYFNHYATPNWSQSIQDYSIMSSFVLNSYDMPYSVDSLLYLYDGKLYMQSVDTTYEILIQDSLSVWSSTDNREMLHTAVEFDHIKGDLYINSINGQILNGEEYNIDDITGILLLRMN